MYGTVVINNYYFLYCMDKKAACLALNDVGRRLWKSSFPGGEELCAAWVRISDNKPLLLLAPFFGWLAWHPL
jgi:hypothetical protein